MDIRDQQDLRMLLKELQRRCPADAVCAGLLECINTAEWERVRRCCEVRLASLKSSYDLLAQGAAHLQLGVLYAMEGDAQLTNALDQLGRAERMLRICDNKSASIALMAVGKVCEAKSQWTKAALAYQQSVDGSSDLHDPLVKTARKWQAAVMKRAAMEPASEAGAQVGSPLPTQAERMTEEQPAKTGPSSEPVEDERSTKATPPTSPPEPSRLLQLRLVPFFEARAVAGRRYSEHVKEGPPVTVDTIRVEGRPFHVRRIVGTKQGGSQDLFDYALLVIGESMQPTMLEGDCVLIHKTTAKERDIVVVRIQDGEEDVVTIKRYHPRGDYVLLKPDNPESEAIVIVEEEKLKQSLEPRLRAEYGERLEIIVGPRSLIEGKVTAILMPAPETQTG